MPIHTIEPVYNSDSRVLILGSFPSVKSREQQFFYGHPQNRFWKVLGTLCGVEQFPETIQEKKEFLPICKKYDVELISLIAPTSHERAAMIAKEAEGFIYLVSSLGVTGVRSKITTNIGEIVKMIKENTDIPCAVGFGISTPEQASQMAAVSDGVIVGSAIIKIVAEHGKDAPKYVGEYVKRMKDAIR